MSQVLKLQSQAIQAAKEHNWQLAVLHNQVLIKLEPQDINAYNRLGAAYLQLGNNAQAKKIFKQVLKLDGSNKLAIKHLEKIKKKQSSAPPKFSNESFIEEPGKTKSIDLYRLAGKNVLNKLSVGQDCQLQLKNRYISISADGQYIGSLPEDISFRLSKLIKTGNQYSCRILACGANHCTVHLREIFRSKKNQHTNSFPNTQASAIITINEVDESMVDNDVPLEIVQTDTDEERTLDDLETPEE
jgi:tetratricopeptide (TPR) repeat protein